MSDLIAVLNGLITAENAATIILFIIAVRGTWRGTDLIFDYMRKSLRLDESNGSNGDT